MIPVGHAVKAGSSAPLQNSPELGCVFHYISRISRECFGCISEGVRLRRLEAPAFLPELKLLHRPGLNGRWGVRRDKAARSGGCKANSAIRC